MQQPATDSLTAIAGRQRVAPFARRRSISALRIRDAGQIRVNAWQALGTVSP